MFLTPAFYSTRFNSSARSMIGNHLFIKSIEQFTKTKDPQRRISQKVILSPWLMLSCSESFQDWPAPDATHEWVFLGEGVVINRMEPKRLLTAGGVSQASLLRVILLKVSADGLGSGTESTSARFWVKPGRCEEHSIISGWGQA